MGRKSALVADPGLIDDQARSLMLRITGVLDPAPTPGFDQWIRALQRNTGADAAATCLNDGPRRFVKSVCTADSANHPTTELLDGQTLQGYLQALAGEVGSSRSGVIYADEPVTLGGHVCGSVGMADARRLAWAENDLAALHDAAVAISTELALEFAQAEADRVAQLLAARNGVHDMIARAAPLRDILITICEIIERYDPSLMPSILMFDPTSSTLHSGVGPSLPAEYVAAIDGVVIGPNIGTCGPAAWFNELTVTPDIATDPKWVLIRELAGAGGVAHCWSMPIRSLNGGVLGTLAFYGRAPRVPLPEQLALLRDWSRVAGIVIERSQALDRLTYDARHDVLTTLPNRSAIFEELDDAIERAAPDAMLAVFFVDLDGLKVLNDSLGHDRADGMLREIAQRLADNSRDTDFVGRFGGDEFIVIADGLAEAEEAGRLGARLLDVISQPLPGLDGPVVTASIGITIVRTNAANASEVIRDADAAMYAAKRSGRDRCVFSEAGHGVHTGRRLQLARALRGAEARGEMSLVFQPIVALPAMAVVGVEALLRWTSPEFGEVGPTEFIPIAEDTGTIIPIGAWALRESCEAMTSLAKLGHELELNVNVSAVQVSKPDFPLWVRNTIAHAGFPANMLGLEITETALMRPNSITSRNLHELQSLGVRIVLDDFGTGYSSLSWLKHHPLGSIKIDRGFVSGLPDDKDDVAIVSAVIGLASSLGCSVTAEGVETAPQLAALNALGCRRVQGFLLARPMPPALLVELLTETASLAG